MKYVLLLAIVGVLWFLFWGRGRRPTVERDQRQAQPPQPMVACAHCGLHLPHGDARFDAAGRAYCGDAHRLAGPRDPR